MVSNALDAFLSLAQSSQASRLARCCFYFLRGCAGSFRLQQRSFSCLFAHFVDSCADGPALFALWPLWLLLRPASLRCVRCRARAPCLPPCPLFLGASAGFEFVERLPASLCGGPGLVGGPPRRARFEGHALRGATEGISMLRLIFTQNESPARQALIAVIRDSRTEAELCGLFAVFGERARP
jgi:hypothetical protein